MGYSNYVDIDTRTLACWAENAWDDCPATPSSFRGQLRIMERNAASLFSSGSIGSVSKNSASQSYAGAGFGRFSVAQIQQGYRMLIELYDTELWETQCIWNLSQTPGNVNQCAINFAAQYPNYLQDPDQSVWDRISCLLGSPVDSYQIDLGDLRLRPTLTAGVRTW